MSTDWRGDIARARADLETALGLVMGVCRPRGAADLTIDDRQYLADARRLSASAADALERVAVAFKEESRGEPRKNPDDECECEHARDEHDTRGDGACDVRMSSGVMCSCPFFKASR